MFLDGVFPTDVFSPGGVYLGKRLAFNVDFARIQSVVSKVVRGLFYATTGRILPQSYDVSVDSNETLERAEPVYLCDLHEQILVPLARTPERIIGDGAFRYRFAIPEVDGNISVWALTFFGTIPFLCITGPRNQQTPGDEY